MPTQLSISDFFAGTLGAPLHNTVWSWGAVRPTDGVIFLRCWTDTIRRIGIDKQQMIEVQWPENEVRKSKPGWLERNEHLARARAGSPAYAVMVTARNVNANPREIDFYNAKEVFELGEIIEIDGITYAQLKARLPTVKIRVI